AAPDRPEAWDAQGEVELAAGRLDEAEASFRRALDLAADFTSPYDGLAAIAFHRGDLHGGIAQLQAGLHATTAVTPPGARIRLLEQLGEAQMIVGQEQAAFDAIARSVEAQGLQDAPVVEAVTHLGRARLLWRTKRWTRARTEALAAREGAPPPFVRWVSTALEASLGALAGDGSAAASALDDVRQGIGHDHPLTLEPAFYVAIANDRLDEAAAALLQLDTVAPYRSDEARLALAHAMVAAQRNDEARALLTVVSRRYRRSVSSAVVRREATAMLETLA
nr:hypothetical protein [Deltaproteobacteria bacterium]